VMLRQSLWLNGGTTHSPHLFYLNGHWLKSTLELLSYLTLNVVKSLIDYSYLAYQTAK